MHTHAYIHTYIGLPLIELDTVIVVNHMCNFTATAAQKYSAIHTYIHTNIQTYIHATDRARYFIVVTHTHSSTATTAHKYSAIHTFIQTYMHACIHRFATD